MAPPDSPGQSIPSLSLIGSRGSGKSTVGRLLAARLEKKFVDTDSLVMETAKKNIREIFELGGEPLFRELEAEAIRHAAAQSNVVIAAGGGVVLSQINVDILKACGPIIWLSASAQVLWQRIAADTTSQTLRPNLTPAGGLPEVQALLARRTPLYAAAADWQTSGEAEPEQVVAAILAHFNQRFGKA